ncbi:hypothetical protein DENSPDRAFT_847219 [Dentipellis sp. KUC8613]|nr:hypothetical protein DENSPDRAFT_847219 [Dentipellis sp. KUC8613]
MCFALRTRSGLKFSYDPAPKASVVVNADDFATMLRSAVAAELGTSPFSSPLSSPSSSPPPSPPPSLARDAVLIDRPPSPLQPPLATLLVDDAPPASAPVGKSKRSPGMRKSKQLRRKKARQEKDAQGGPRDRKMRSSLSRRNTEPVAIKVQFSLTALTAARGADVGVVDLRRDSAVWSLDDYLSGRLGRKFKLMQWDGSKVNVLCDTQDRVFGVMAAIPRDPKWPEVISSAADAMEDSRVRGRGQWQHGGRRGNYHAVNVGVAYGTGQKVPGNLKLPEGTDDIVRELVAHPSIQRIAGLGSALLQSYAPKIYRHYADNLDVIFKSDPSCVDLFKNSIFPTAAFNLGPQCVTRGHKDTTNVPHGLCVITSMGNFNYKKGGHLVLWDLGLIIEFPPGATILIPSSTIRHGNTSIASHERRYSFTQYCMGGLLRWVRHGLRPAESLSEAERRLLDGSEDEAFQRAIDMFSKLSELQSDREVYLQVQ